MRFLIYIAAYCYGGIVSRYFTAAIHVPIRFFRTFGFSSIHLAMQHGQKRIVLGFVDIHNDVVRVKGREGLTPLHFASQTVGVDLLANIKSWLAGSRQLQRSAMQLETSNSELEGRGRKQCFEAKEFGEHNNLSATIIFSSILSSSFFLFFLGASYAVRVYKRFQGYAKNTKIQTRNNTRGNRW